MYATLMYSVGEDGKLVEQALPGFEHIDTRTENKTSSEPTTQTTQGTGQTSIPIDGAAASPKQSDNAGFSYHSETADRSGDLALSPPEAEKGAAPSVGIGSPTEAAGPHTADSFPPIDTGEGSGVQSALPDPEKRYREMLSDPEMKRIEQKRIDNAFRARYGEEMGRLRDKLKAHEGLLEKLHTVFGTNDLRSLEKAIDGSDELYVSKAEERGMTTKQYREQLETERLARKYREEQEAAAAETRKQQEANERMNRELAEFNAEYPGVVLLETVKRYGDINSADNKFMQLWERGLSLSEIYKLLGNVPVTARPTSQAEATTGNQGNQTAQNTQRNTIPPRPPENASANRGDDVRAQASLTEKERAAIARWG